jgi:outer membrane protein
MMKKLLLAAFAVFAFTSVDAQTEKGNWVFGGNTSLSFASTKAKVEVDGNEVDGDLTSTVFSVTPSVGYFVIDNLAVGLDLSFTSNKNDNGDTDVTTSSFSVLPMGTYFFDAGESFKPYVGAGVGLISTSSGDEDINKSSGLAIRGKGGVAYFLNESIALDFSVQYLNSSQKNKENSDVVTKNSSFGVGFGFSIFL